MKHLQVALSLILTSCLLPAQDVEAFGKGEGITGEVLALAVQKDGRVVIGGSFTAVNGVPRQNLARLNADGTLDATFIPRTVEGPNGPVAALLVLSDGSVVAGGNFTAAGNLVRGDLVKYKADGTADSAFGGMEGGVATNGSISALTLLPDGSIVVGGSFTTFYGQPRRSIARLNADGTVAKSTRESDTLSGTVKALGTGPEGAVFAGGGFSSPDQSARGILRLGH